ncbi:transmembrane protein 45B-like [Ptychodera flava]|uniref:transmembrane protein 45B-like n=1 Tax=Ptychodera flava TaxID=63121 RepID=UPI00396A6836
MGSFEGHIHPGLAFISIAIFWGSKYSYLHQYREYGKGAKTSSNGRFIRFVKRVPWEAFIKIFYGLAAAFAEFLHPPVIYNLRMFKDGELQNPNNWQHLTMYSFFAIAGLVDIISQKCLEKRAEKLERFFLALAFCVEAHLLLNHRHGKGGFENTCHLMNIIATLGCVVAATAEVWNPSEILLPFLRVGFTMLQGTWLFNIAFLIYKPVSGEHWDADGSGGGVMFVTMLFCWHIFVDMVLVTINYCVVYAIFGRKWKRQCNIQKKNGEFIDLSEKTNNEIGVHGESEEAKIPLFDEDDEF